MTEEFSVNFGDAKEPVLPDEGNYTFVIVEYAIKPVKAEENRSKGFNIPLTLKIVDDAEFDDAPMWYNLYVHKENPWGAKLFFDALTGRDTAEYPVDVTDVDYFIGERIGCAVVHEEYESKKGQSRTKIVPAGPDAWYTV